MKKLIFGVLAVMIAATSLPAHAEDFTFKWKQNGWYALEGFTAYVTRPGKEQETIHFGSFLLGETEEITAPRGTEIFSSYDAWSTKGTQWTGTTVLDQDYSRTWSGTLGIFGTGIQHKRTIGL